jgi:hypothetical protein
MICIHFCGEAGEDVLARVVDCEDAGFMSGCLWCRMSVRRNRRAEEEMT